MSKIVNLRIDENATFTKTLQFTKKVKDGETYHPITGKPIATYKSEPISLKGYTIAAQIKASLDDDAALIAVFEAKIMDSSKGLAYIALTKEQTAVLDKFAAVEYTGIKSDRVYLLGFYDVLLIDEYGVATRVFQGKCYFSKAATKDPLVASNTRTTVVTKSKVMPITGNIELPVDKTKAHYYAGIQYFSGGVQVTPTSGTVDIYRMTATANTYQDNPTGILLATSPASEIGWHSNTQRVRAEPKNVAGATAYQLVVVSNLS